jgi:hypothetical protein
MIYLYHNNTAAYPQYASKRKLQLVRSKGIEISEIPTKGNSILVVSADPSVQSPIVIIFLFEKRSSGKLHHLMGNGLDFCDSRFAMSIFPMHSDCQCWDGTFFLIPVIPVIPVIVATKIL